MIYFLQQKKAPKKRAKITKMPPHGGTIQGRI